MVSHMVFLTKLGFENLKNPVTPSPFCNVGRVTELPDGRVTSSPWETKKFQGLNDDFGLKRPNHHLGGKKSMVPVYGETFLRNIKFYAKTLTKLHDLTVPF
jgi:hypothetical protein